MYKAQTPETFRREIRREPKKRMYLKCYRCGQPRYLLRTKECPNGRHHPWDMDHYFVVDKFVLDK